MHFSAFLSCLVLPRPLRSRYPFALSICPLRSPFASLLSTIASEMHFTRRVQLDLPTNTFPHPCPLLLTLVPVFLFSSLPSLLVLALAPVFKSSSSRSSSPTTSPACPLFILRSPGLMHLKMRLQLDLALCAVRRHDAQVDFDGHDGEFNPHVAAELDLGRRRLPRVRAQRRRPRRSRRRRRHPRPPIDPPRDARAIGGGCAPPRRRVRPLDPAHCPATLGVSPRNGVLCL